VTAYNDTSHVKSPQTMTSPVRHPTAGEIADMADSGLDISRFFTNQGEMKQPLASIRVDISQDMLNELDQLAAELHVSRQAAINSCLRHALDQQLLAKRGKT